jgi:3D (Asp-Asp-Asp) domain-containing protein
MNNIILIILFILQAGYFHPDSDYLNYGRYRFYYYNTSQAKTTTTKPGNRQSPKIKLTPVGVRNWHLIPFRTIAVDPQKMLVGSVLFIPQLIGMPLPGGLLHDGYVLAHDVRTDRNDNAVFLYTGNDNGWRKLNGSGCDVYGTRGIMASTIRHQYRLQYCDKNDRQTYEMTWKELQQLMQKAHEVFPEINSRIQYLSSKGVGTPYVMFHLGEGGTALYDPDPTVNFAQTDCMTFCEHTLALAISTTYQEMYTNLQRIRYKEGVMKITTRNHYTLADWLPNNDWLLRNITRDIGGSLCRRMTKTIDRKKALRLLGIPENELADVLPPHEVTIDYLPEEVLLQIAVNLSGGEIVSIVSERPGIFSAHMGIIVRDEWNTLIFRHGSSIESVKEVVDVSYEEIVEQLRQSSTRVGMVFMRAKN